MVGQRCSLPEAHTREPWFIAYDEYVFPMSLYEICKKRRSPARRSSSSMSFLVTCLRVNGAAVFLLSFPVQIMKSQDSNTIVIAWHM